MTKKPASNKPAEDNEVEVLKQQLGLLTEALQRERADATNIRRRHEEETANLRRIVKANIVRELLPVIDNLERSLKHAPKQLEDDPYIRGVEGVIKQFNKTLSDMGVQRIKTVNEVFDPKYHEAVSFEEGEGKTEVIYEELQPGYSVDGEIIRHAVVKVKMQ